MLLKVCSHCGKKIPVTEKCECAIKREKERMARYKEQYTEQQREAYKKYNMFKRDKKKQAFYNSPAWLRIRESVLAKANGMDEYEFSQGYIVPANTVHHIVPIGKDWDRRLDITNLIALNRKTHKFVHLEYDANEERMRTMEKKLFEIVNRRERKTPQG